MILSMENHYQPYLSISHHNACSILRSDRSERSSFHSGKRSKLPERPMATEYALVFMGLFGTNSCGA